MDLKSSLEDILDNLLLWECVVKAINLWLIYFDDGHQEATFLIMALIYLRERIYVAIVELVIIFL